MSDEPKPDRRFRLASLLGVVTLIAVALGMIHIGMLGPSHVPLFRTLKIIGSLSLAAVVGGVVGLVIGGRRYIVPGALVGVVLCVFVIAIWLFPPIPAARE